MYDIWNESDIETGPEKNAVNILAVRLLIVIEVRVSQGSFPKN